MSREYPQGFRRIVTDSVRRGGWEDYDPRIEEYTNLSNCYNSGPGRYMPIEHIYNPRTSRIPYTLFVCGIHPHTTEEGIRHIFSNYGHPLSVKRTRNRLNQPIAFVDFGSQMEADNAIIELDGNPPLNWSVSYAMKDRNEMQLPLDSDFDRQMPLFPATVGNIARPITFPETSSMIYRREPAVTVTEIPSPVVATARVESFPPCNYCRREAHLVCHTCKTRYCSPSCQSSDWPNHRKSCIPPPALEPASTSVPSTRVPTPTVSANGVPNVDPQDGTNLAIVRRSDGVSITMRHPQAAYEEMFKRQQQDKVTKLTSPGSYMIKGIHPLDQEAGARQQQANADVRQNAANESGVKPLESPVNGNNCNGVTSKSSTVKVESAEPSPSINNLPSRTNGRSPNWKNNDMEQPVKRSPQYENRANTVSHVPTQQGVQGVRPKSRNYPLGNYSPKSPIVSPPRMAQPPQPVVKKMYAKEYTNTELKIPQTEICKVVICFAKSPDEFYIQFAAHRKLLESLTNDLKISALKSDPLTNPKVGLPCAALYQGDITWYRGVVWKIMDNGIVIRYVDYGNRSLVQHTRDRIRMLEHNFSDTPFFAVKAKLFDVLPLNGESWSPDAIEKFRELAVEKAFYMERTGVDQDTMCVRLKGIDDVDLSTQLIKEGIAKSKVNLEISDALDKLSVKSETSGTTSQQVMALSTRLSHLKLQTKPSPIAASRPAGPDTDVSPQRTSTNSVPIKTTVLPPSTSPARADLRPAVPNTQVSPLRPPANSEVSMKTTALPPITSPVRAALRQTTEIQPRAPTLPPVAACARLVTPAISTVPQFFKSNSIIEILDVGTKFHFMVAVCGNQFAGTLVFENADLSALEFHSFAEKLELPNNFTPSVGSVVAVHSREHNQWFRGCVTKVNNASFSVLYVDYGNIEENVVSLKPIPSSYQSPELAVGLTFFGDLAPNARQFIDENMILETNHELEVISKDGRGSVLAKFVEANLPNFIVCINPWTSLLNLEQITSPLITSPARTTTPAAAAAASSPKVSPPTTAALSPKVSPPTTAASSPKIAPAAAAAPVAAAVPSATSVPAAAPSPTKSPAATTSSAQNPSDTDAPTTRKIPSLEWESGYSCDVQVVLADDVDSIYVQLALEESILATTFILEELAMLYPTCAPFTVVPPVGTYVAALFPEDGGYYRAQITKVDGDCISLFYVDFGNCSEVTLNEIRHLPESLYLPACCKRILLSCVERPEGPLPSAVKDVLSSYVNLICNMLVVSSYSGVAECTLTKDGKVLNEIIAELFAQHIPEKQPTLDSTAPESTNDTAEMPKLEPASPDTIPAPEEDIPGDNTLGQFSYQDGPFFKLPEGEPFQALVLDSPSPQVTLLRLVDENAASKLAKLQKEITIYAESVVLGHAPEQSEICIARFPDGNWYRAACLEVVNEAAGKLYFCIQVDCGKLHYIDVTQIRRIPKRFVDYLPYLAQQTILEGTETLQVVETNLAHRFSELLPEGSIVTVTSAKRCEGDEMYIVRLPEISATLTSEGLLQLA